MKLHSILIPLVTALVLFLQSTGVHSYEWPQTVFEDEFESGDLYAWLIRNVQGNDARLTATTDLAHSGHFATRASVTGTGRAYLSSPTFSQADEVYCRAYVHFESATLAEGQFFTFLAPHKVGMGALEKLSLKRKAGRLILSAESGGDGTTEIALSRWYCIELHYRYAGSPGSGSLTVWLDGRVEVNAVGLNYRDRADQFSAGYVYSAFSNAGAVLLIDDIVIDRQPIGRRDPAVRIYHPDFQSRVGARIVVVTAGHSATDRLTVGLRDPDGQETQVFNGPTTGRVPLPLNLRGLSQGRYTLTASLTSEAGQLKANDNVVYDKPYDGDPEVTIDEHNNFLIRGQKHFPVTGFGVRTRDLELWTVNQYHNHAYGQQFGLNETNGVSQFGLYLETARNNGLYVIGPTITGRGAKTSEIPMTDAIVLEYIERHRNHPNLSGWDWFDEPELYKYTAEDYKRWWDYAKARDPKRWTHVNFMGTSIIGTDFSVGVGRSYIYPRLVADVYSFDAYVHEYTNQFNLAHVALACERLKRWNFDMVPFFAYVAPCDVVYNQLGGAPSPTQVRQVAWLSVVQGAKGIHWYPWKVNPTPENFVAMSQFTKDVTALKEAVLSPHDANISAEEIAPPPPFVTREGYGRNLYFMAKHEGRNTYIFAVSAATVPLRCKFTVPNLALGESIAVYGTSTELRAQDGWFEDTLNPEGVKIYILSRTMARVNNLRFIESGF